MAIVVLFSTMSFTIDMHYCGGTLVDKAVFKKAESCGMEMEIGKSNASSECTISKKNCCSDEQLNLIGQNELQITFDKYSFDQQYFTVSNIVFYLQLYEGIEPETSSVEYPPPLIVRQIYKLDEVYLI